jgi:CheY-like chemotaxis protein
MSTYGSILMAEDDPDDQLLAKIALQSANYHNPFICVDNGQELIEYLQRAIKSTNNKTQLLPNLIIIDLNMPKLSGLDTLDKLKSDDNFKSIPVVILSTSCEPNEVTKSYRKGASSYICKPVNFDKLVAIMQQLGSYWLDIVEVP